MWTTFITSYKKEQLVMKKRVLVKLKESAMNAKLESMVLPHSRIQNNLDMALVEQMSIDVVSA